MAGRPYISTTRNVLFWGGIILLSLAVETSGMVRKRRTKARLVLDEEMDIYNEVKTLKEQIKVLQANQRKDEAASTYTRWGRTVCTNISDYVYKGYIAGKKYDDVGSGSDTQCLPDDPTWNKYDVSPSAFRGKIYGSELDAWSGSHIFDKDVFNEDMPCVLCRTPFPTTVMFPARKDCYPGWTLQYSGYLVTNLAGPGRGSYESICLDVDPEFLPNSVADNNEHVLYLIDVECGSLPCPPYIQGAELACAVCSK